MKREGEMSKLLKIQEIKIWEKAETESEDTENTEDIENTKM